VPEQGDPASGRRRKAIPATCQLHRGPIGFANLMVSRHNGTIVFDPHVTGSCVISLDEDGGRDAARPADRVAAVNPG